MPLNFLVMVARMTPDTPPAQMIILRPMVVAMSTVVVRGPRE